MDGLRRLPRFPCPSAPPPGPYGPVSRGLPGRGGPSGGRAPGPDGIRRLAPGPVVMAPPRFHRMRKDRAPDHRIRIPRSGDRDAVQRIRTNTGREGRREGKERMDARTDTNGGIRVDEDE